MKSQSLYQERIAKICQEQGLRGIYANPRWIEAYMRLEHSTLDNLSIVRFTNEVKLCHEIIRLSGEVSAENLAKSFNL